MVEKARANKKEKKPVDLYLKTTRTIEETTNEAGEDIYVIEGEYSIDGKDWKPCNVIWNDKG